MIDEPKFRTSVGEVPITSKLGYFRLHGRNAMEWWKGDRESRYNYLYSPEELANLAGEVKQVTERTGDAFVFYNNHYGAKAVVNALQMRLQFGQRVPRDLPETMLETDPELEEVVAKTS